MNKDDLIEMIPDYLNGNLDQNLTALLESAAENDDAIRLEISFMQSIQEKVKNETIQSPSDWGWARLKNTIEQQELAQKKEKPIQTTGEKQPLKPVSAIKPIWKKLAFAASFAFIAQSAFLLQDNFITTKDYQLLSTETLSNSIQVKFTAGTTEQEIRSLLIKEGATIVGGPSALGLYTIKFNDNDTTLERLRQNSIIDYAELSEASE